MLVFCIVVGAAVDGVFVTAGVAFGVGFGLVATRAREVLARRSVLGPDSAAGLRSGNEKWVATKGRNIFYRGPAESFCYFFVGAGELIPYRDGQIVFCRIWRRKTRVQILYNYRTVH